ncbi:MAG: hypothetical protein WBQ24_01350 [Xanthobacteraceae bacterium]
MAIFCAVAAATVPAISAHADNWLTYHNDRYGTTIDYPDQFKAEPPPGSDDGRTFKSADGAEFSVYASYNALDFNLAKFQDFTLKNLDPGAVVTYKTHGDNWFVISGTEGDDIFYERHMLSHDGQMTEGFSMSYPAAAKQSYDPVVARMAKSFRAGKGFQSP